MQLSELYAKYPRPLVDLLYLDDSETTDWEWCVSDEDRVEEFIDFYITMPLNDNDKMSLMMIIIDSYNSRVWNHGFSNDTWENISNLIKENILFFKEQIIYWSSMDHNDDEMDDAWAIAANMRILLRNLNENSYLTDEDIEDWCNDAKMDIFD